MLNRRLALGTALAAGLFTLAGTAGAQSWKAQYPELVFAVIPAENASGVTERYGPFIEYLAKELGTKVTLRVANDYAAVIEGQRNGSIHLAGYGPASPAASASQRVAHEGSPSSPKRATFFAHLLRVLSTVVTWDRGP